MSSEKTLTSAPSASRCYAVGDTVCGTILWGDRSVMECRIYKLDAGISRDAFIVETPSGDHAVMLLQSVVESAYHQHSPGGGE